MNSNKDIGKRMYEWAEDIFPIHRSITGNGVRQTLKIIKNIIPDLKIYEESSGKKVFDWQIPSEWNINDAYIATEHGEKLIDFKENNLHVLGYSLPFDDNIEYDELEKHLFSLPEKPEAIPYITSYYNRKWGFCVSEIQRKRLKEYSGVFKVKIDSDFNEKGSLTYGELIIPGEVEEEILFSTYICHPSMGNNETSGIVLTTALAEFLSERSNYFTYRFVFVPETIGSIVYLSKNLKTMKRNIKAGYVVTCVGDNRTYSLLLSKYGNTLADKVAKHVLKFHYSNYKEYSFLERGSDERQYNAPGVDLPVASIMRSKYLEYPEYHTSLDDLNLISPEGLKGAFDVYKKCIVLLENNKKYKLQTLCEPQLGKRGLYPTTSTNETKHIVKDMMNFLAYCDGKNDLIDICEYINVHFVDLLPLIEKLLKNKIIENCI